MTIRRYDLAKQDPALARLAHIAQLAAELPVYDAWYAWCRAQDNSSSHGG